MKARAVASALILVCGLVMASCDSESPRASQPVTHPSPDTVALGVHPPPDTVPLGVHRPSDLVEAATEIVGFLRGEVAFDRIQLADTVTLYLSKEAGGARRTVRREVLRNPSNWTVGTGDLPHVRGAVYTFAPPKGTAELTTRVGRHLNCFEYPLSSRVEELTDLPHVGTRLMFGDQGSCLQSWNLTLVFDPAERSPTLIAAVYDRWEW